MIDEVDRLQKYFLSLELAENYTAGSKAKVDVEYFLYQCGFKKLNLYEGTAKLHKLTSFFYKLHTLPFDKKGKVILAIHYPLLNSIVLRMFVRILKLRRYDITIVGIIHDIDSLRYSCNHETIKREIKMLNMFDYIISHNSAMTRWLVGQGLKGKIQELELFDYQVSSKEITEKIEVIKSEKNYKSKYIISFAGNLDHKKSSFIYSLDNVDFSNLLFYLYGPGFNGSKILKKNIIYKGVYESDILPLYIEGGWGLIWDGESIESCSGVFGNYLRYNSPHKLSLYIVGGLPIIVWSKAAASEIVKKYKIGITVDSLEEIHQKLINVTDEEYQEYKENVLTLTKKLKEGEFIIGAFNKIIESVEEVRINAF